MKEYAKSMATCDEALLIDAEHHAGKHRAELEQQKGKATMAMYGMAGAEEGGESMEERQKRAMSDPKVQEIMNDPTMRMILQQMSTDPMAVQEYVVVMRGCLAAFDLIFITTFGSFLVISFTLFRHMKNPFVREKIMLLANAGIIQLR